MSIKVTRASMPDFEEYIQEIRSLWDSRWLTNMGVKHIELETKLLEYLKVNNITLFTNGHLALEYIIESLDLTGEVITTPFTFASTTHAIVRSGLKPVFCDINPDDYTIDINKIEGLINERTSAIIPVHVYGNVCDVKGIERIAGKYALKVIYDAAHSFGVEIDGRGIGSFGDASMFSFHATKVFNTIEGGAVTYKDRSIKHKLDCLKNFGISDPDTIEYVGGNAKMNEFQSAMGLCNLRNVDHNISKRRLVTERYMSNLKELEGIKLPETQKGIKSNYSYFPVIFDKYKKTRDEIFEELRLDNIIARKYFYPTINSFACYRDKYNEDDTPVAKDISKKVLTLPLYPDLDLEDVDIICEIIKNGGGKN